MRSLCIFVIFLVLVFPIESTSNFTDFNLINNSQIICANFSKNQNRIVDGSHRETQWNRELSNSWTQRVEHFQVPIPRMREIKLKEFDFVNLRIAPNTSIHPKLYCVGLWSAIITWSNDKEYDELAIQISSDADQSNAIYSHSSSQEKYHVFTELYEDAEYQVLMLNRNFTYGKIFRDDVATLNFTTISRQNWTYPADFWLNLTDFSPVNETHMNVTVKWNSSSEVLPCSFLLYWFTSGSFPESVVCTNPEFKGCIAPNLRYGTIYEIWFEIYTKKSESLRLALPGCHQVAWNKNWTCTISKIQKIYVDDENCTDELYCAVTISWVNNDAQPDYYNVTFERQISSGNWTFYETKIVKNENNVTVNLPYKTLLRVAITTHIGNVASDPTVERLFVRSSPPIRITQLLSTPNTSNGNNVMYAIVFLIVVLIIFAISLFLRHRYKSENTPRLKKLYGGILIKNMETIPSNIEVKKKFKEAQEYKLILGKMLGKGNFGIVFQGTLMTNGKKIMDVAVKTLRDNASSKDIEQFEKEINLMEDVGFHINIVSMIGSCPNGKRPLLIVEYCSLGDLHAYLCDVKKTQVNFSDYNSVVENKYQNLVSIGRGDDSKYLVHNKIYGVTKDVVVPQLSICDLLSFGRQVAIGMEYLASNYVVHRDLAARNILLCSDKTVKISDFGLSRDIYAENIYRKLEGGEIMPIKWMALESICNREYSTLSDVWSFGIFLWELFTMGDEPYPDITVVDVLVLQLKEGYRMQNPCPSYPQIYEMMLNCWHEQPELRPQFSDLRDLLDQILKQCSPNQYITITGNED